LAGFPGMNKKTVYERKTKRLTDNIGAFAD